MAAFETFFRKSNGNPIIHEGQVIHLYDKVPIENGQEFEIVFESAHGTWRQGVGLSIDGCFEVNYGCGKNVDIWQDTAPHKVRLKASTSRGWFAVINIWDNGDGCHSQGHNGAAMIVEETEFGRRYRCNDGEPDDDFDDLVFEVRTKQLIPQDSTKTSILSWLTNLFGKRGRS